MSTTRTETTSEKKSAAQPGTKSAGKPAAKAPATAPLSPGGLIAARYRDTPYESLVGKNGETVTAAMTAGEAVLAGVAELSQEMMTFAGARLRHDIETAEEIAKAGSPEEFFEKQRSFVERAAQQYAEETSKLIAMMARIQQSCWQPMEQCTKTALQSLNGANGADGANGKDDEKQA
ncbi:MAG: phasin family protein [Kiloniellaceae bacterium]